MLRMPLSLIMTVLLPAMLVWLGLAWPRATWAQNKDESLAIGLPVREAWSPPANLGDMRLRVEGARLLDGRGQPVLLHGVNIPSLEWSSDGEYVHEALHVATSKWKANLIRLPISLDRWYGKAPEQTDGGLEYRWLIDSLVQRAMLRRVYLLIDLHWTNLGTWGKHMAQHKLPGVNAIAFWEQVADLYKDQPHVLFGLYNEPRDVTWDQWLHGGMIEGDKKHGSPIYEAAGMQQLYDAVRRTGAQNIVVVGGLDWAFDLSAAVTTHRIEGFNLMYDTHVYSFKGRQRWDKAFGNPSQQVPVLVGEWGGKTKDGQFGRELLQYMHDRQMHWTAWCFHPTADPPLIEGWTFRPTPFGELVRTYLTGKSE